MKTLIIFPKLSNSTYVLGILAKGPRNLNRKSKFSSGIQDKMNVAAITHKLTSYNTQTHNLARPYSLKKH